MGSDMKPAVFASPAPVGRASPVGRPVKLSQLVMSGALQGTESVGSENAEAPLLLATWTFQPAAGASGEVAADHVLDVQRFALPLGLFAAAQPRLGRRPPLRAVLAGEHHPPPCLNDVAERPQIPPMEMRSSST
jgi:hypothetical protein